MACTPTISGVGISPPADTDGKASPEGGRPLEVAVIGGGIVGIVLALGLIHRGMRVKVYERANDFHEIGAGIAFTGVARECMARLSPRVIESMRRVGDENRNSFYRYWDGYNVASEEDVAQSAALLFQLPIADLKYWGCLRAHLLDDLAKVLPEGIVQFNKQLVDYREDDENVTLYFSDGTTAKTDALVGCDGIKSRVRQILFGESDSAALASYTHKACYRTVVPIAQGVAALGHDKSHNQCMHMGPGAHVLTYPVAGWTLLNVVIFLADPNPWPDPSRLTLPGTRDEVVGALANWGPAVRGVADLLPPELLKWGIFDMAEHPAPTYARGRVCLAGDAAHASSPHLGAGAGFGVEDALALATALEEAQATLRQSREDGRAVAVAAALQAFNAVRSERTQWLVRSSREAGDLYEWVLPGIGNDIDKCKAGLAERTQKIWDFDVDEMVDGVKSQYHCRV